MIEIGNISIWAIIGIGILLVSGVYYYLVRPGIVVFLLRMAVLLLAVILLVQPVRVVRQASSGKPVLAVLADRSGSMGVKDPQERLARVRQFIGEHLARWKRRAEVRLYLFSDTTTLTSEDTLTNWKPGGGATYISRALDEIGLEVQDRLSAVLLLSDGRDNGPDDPAEAADRLGVPVFTAGVGSSYGMKDILIADITAGDFAFKNTPLDVGVRLRSYGFAGKTVPVRLSQGKEVLSVREVKLPDDGGDVETKFTITPKNIGSFTYSVLVPFFTGEVSRKNNRAEFSVDVIREKLRILYICGGPGYEYAYLREALKSDPAVELVSFVILRNPENIAFVPDHELSLIPFPVREIFLEKLFSFDLLLFENFSYARFGFLTSYLENIRRYVVDKGGAFIMIGGPNSFGSGKYKGTPIEDILPVILPPQDEVFVIAPFRARPRGLEHPIMNLADTKSRNAEVWGALPKLVGFNRYGMAKDGAVVLAEHPWEQAGGKPLPVITVWQKGKGRVMAVASNTTWRWAMGFAKEGKTAFSYNRFWRGAVRWLTQAEEMKLVLVTLDTRQVKPGEVMRIRIVVKNEAYDPLTNAQVTLQITGPDGIRRNIPCYEGEAGSYHAEYEPWEVGTYLLRAEAADPRTGKNIGADTRRINVLSFSRETVELNLNERLLEEIAERSGGSYQAIDLFDDRELFRTLTVRRRGDVLRKVPVWAHPAIFVLMMGLLFIEWYVRRRQGLP